MSTSTESEGPDQAVAPARADRTKVWIAIAAAGVLVGLATGWFVVHQDPEAPYTDPAATGTLTFCNVDGSEVTRGSTKDAPFADLVVGSTAVDGQYAQGGTATLLAYQPREGVSPEEFSGGLLTKATTVTDVAHPFARISDRSTTLADFTAAYPATWDGYVQLRLVVGGVGAPPRAKYDTADVRIDGDRWELVTGGGGDCRGTAQTARNPVP
ncbi:MAG: hypothetical protein NTV23_12240 [Propionibacteriales bacterium]|nr:hypothetical protein [Propionibacteriales bacterium]